MREQCFSFNLATSIILGWGAAEAAGEQACTRSAKRALVVTDSGVLKAGLLEPVCSSLTAVGLELQVFSDVQPNPTAQNCLDCTAALTQAKSDVIIAVGGGSAMDTAKIGRVLRDNGGQPADYWKTGRTISAPRVPLICVPTTAGTGSEVSPYAVINDPTQADKLTLGGRNVAPQIAIVDPELHMGCPATVTAHSGVDALIHAIESYTSTLASPLTDGIAFEAIGLCGRFLVRAYRNGADREARFGMACAATLAGISFGTALLGLCHAISGPLGKHLHLSHGLATGMLLPHVLSYNLPAAETKLNRVAKALGSNDVVQAAADLLAALDLPAHLSEAGLTESLIPVVARDSLSSINFQLNPRRATATAVEDLLRAAL